MNHNYEREHRFNLWFVVTAGSGRTIAGRPRRHRTGRRLPILRPPLEQEFHIDLGSASTAARKPAAGAIERHTYTPPRPLEELERRLVMALQEGLPSSSALPGAGTAWVARRSRSSSVFAAGATKASSSASVSSSATTRLGFKANAMLRHDIPDSEVEARWQNPAGAGRGVTLCYRRPRVLPDWPYNLFCMIHGQAREEVEARIATLRAEAGLQAYPHEILFSLTRFQADRRPLCLNRRQRRSTRSTGASSIPRRATSPLRPPYAARRPAPRHRRGRTDCTPSVHARAESAHSLRADVPDRAHGAPSCLPRWRCPRPSGINNGAVNAFAEVAHNYRRESALATPSTCGSSCDRNEGRDCRCRRKDRNRHRLAVYPSQAQRNTSSR